MNCGNTNFMYPGNAGAGAPGGNRNQGVMTQPISLPQQGNFSNQQMMGQMSAQMNAQMNPLGGMGVGGGAGMPNFVQLGGLSNISALPPPSSQQQFPNFGGMAQMGGMGPGGFGGLNQLGGLGLGPVSGLTQMGGAGGLSGMQGMQGLGQFPMLQMGGQQCQMPQLGQQHMMQQMHGDSNDFAHQLNLNAFHQGLGQAGPGQQAAANMQKMNTSNGLLNMFRKA